MRKIILLLVFLVSLITIISCSNDDSPSDPLVGRWKLIEIIYNEDSLDPGCNGEGILKFFINGTYSVDLYLEDINNDCIFEETINGVWNNLGEGKYEFEREDNEPDIIDVVFSQNTFSITLDQTTTIYRRQ